MADFRVSQIDHVELFVPDQYEAAKWYAEVLGLEILRDYEDWAVDGGPLMLSSDGGSTKLALFRGEPPHDKPLVGHRRVAFRVDGDGFLTFLDRLASQPVSNDMGQPLTRDQVVDHDKAYSIYFRDPYGNRYEITTYDYALAKSRLF